MTSLAVRLAPPGAPPTNVTSLTGDPRRSAAAVTGLSATVAAVAVLRHLGLKPLWRDEAISVSVATRPVARILSVLPHHDANAGLYYLLLHGWLRVGNSGATWARGLSALAFVATAALASCAMCRWLGWRAGLACGLLVATNPFLVYYGQETRPYALAVCLAVVSAVALFWHRDRPAPRAYVAVTAVLLYVELFAVIFVLALALGIVVARRIRSEPLPRVLIRCWAILAAVSAPLGLVMVVGQRGQISWLTRPDLGVLERTVTAMASGWIGLALVAALGVTALAAAFGWGPWRDLSATGGPAGAAIVVALAAGFVVPPAVLWGLSQVVPSFIDRYVICSAAAMAGLGAAGLDALRRGAGTLVALAVLGALGVLGAQRIATLEAGPFKVDNAPAARAFITSQAQPGDAVGYAGGGLRIVIDAAATARALPPDITLAPGGEAFRQHDLYARQVSAADLQSQLPAVRRLWVVTDARDQGYPPDGPLGQLRTTVAAMFAPGATGTFGAIDVTLYVRRQLGA